MQIVGTYRYYQSQTKDYQEVQKITDQKNKASPFYIGIKKTVIYSGTS